MEVGAERRLRRAGVDDDHLGTAFAGHVQELHCRRHGVRRIGADQHDGVGFGEICQGKRQSTVDPEHPGGGVRGRGHAEPTVVVDCGRAKRHPREFAELVGLFVRQPAAAEAADAVAAMGFLGAGEGGGHAVQRVVPAGRSQRRVPGVPHQRLSQPSRVIQKFGRRPALRAEPAEIGREVLLRRDGDRRGRGVERHPALQRAVGAVRLGQRPHSWAHDHVPPPPDVERRRSRDGS